MAAMLFSISLSPQFLSLPSSSSSSSFNPAPSAFFPSKIPQHRALASPGRRHPLAPLAVAVSSDVETEVAQEFSEDLRVFVGNLPFSVDSAQLAGLFEQAGSVEMVEVIYDKLTGRSRGFGFVTMSTVEEVEEAVERLNGYVLDGRSLKVNSGPPPPKDQSSPRGFREQSGGFRQQSSRGPGGGDNRVYVGNLSWNVDDSALANLFNQQGSVLGARVIYDRESGRSRGFGFVTYGTSDEVEKAVSNLDGSDLDGRQIRFFVETDPIANAIGRKDPLQKKVTKRTPSAVAAGAPGDTWPLPPRCEAAGPCRHRARRQVARNGNRGWQRNGLARWGPAALGAGGSPCEQCCRHGVWRHVLFHAR